MVKPSKSDTRVPVVVAYGTRPEAIKLAPVVRALTRSPYLRPIVAVSGQHRRMLDQVNDLFGVSPDYDLNIMAPLQSLTHITSRALVGYAEVLDRVDGHAVVVQGDTTTTFAASLAAFYCRVPVVHVEAGLRTGDRYSPFPEEINRRLTSQLATLHLAPTPLNKTNLLQDGIPESAIRITGNTVIDALLEVVARRDPIGVPELDEAVSAGRRILLVTVHRRESWGEPMVGIGTAVAELAERFPDVVVALPAHLNPRVRQCLLPQIGGLPNVVVTEPLAYGPFAALLASSTLVLTDSGGVQEEAPSVGKPVLVLRETTERPEAIEAGTAAVIGTDPQRIVKATSDLLCDPASYSKMARAVNPYGDGRATERCVAAIGALLGLGDNVPEFVGGVSRPNGSREPWIGSVS